MKKTIMVSILTLAMLVVFGLAGTQAKAESVKFTVTSYITKTEAIPVPDVEGHILLVGERRGLANFEGGEVAAYHTRFICDLTKMHGPCDGYTDLTYMDKSQTMVNTHLPSFLASQLLSFQASQPPISPPFPFFITFFTQKL